MPRIAIILGGGDWTDASVDPLIVPDDLDLAKEKEKYNTWYHEVYCIDIEKRDLSAYMSFVDWLIQRGARHATEADGVQIVTDN
jgi:hypothetical protein